MTDSRIRTRAATAILTLTLAGLGAGMINGGTAFAADNSAAAQFLDEITINNATLPQKSADEMVAAGYATCADLSRGVSVLDEIDTVQQKYQFDQGVLFVSASTTHLCPNFAG